MPPDAARALDRGDEVRGQTGLIKSYGARVLHDVIGRAMHVHGALHVTSDTPQAALPRIGGTGAGHVS